MPLAVVPSEPRRHSAVAAALAVVVLILAAVVSIERPAAQTATVDPPQGARGGYYIVEYTLGPGWVRSKPPSQQTNFAEHSANLRRLRDAGQLLLGARYSDKGIVILKAASQTEAHAEIHKDPSLASGTFVAAIHEFRPFYDGCVLNDGPPKAAAEPAAPSAAIACVAS